MPSYLVRLSKSELVMLEAQIRIEAESEAAACAELRHRILRGYEIEDSVWYEVDSSNLRETIRVVDAQVAVTR